MSATLPIHPSLDHLKKQARQLLAAHRRGESAATDRISGILPGFGGARVALHDTQSVIAREHGFDSWSRLRAEVRLRVGLPHGEPEHVILVEPSGDRVRPADRHINCLAFPPGSDTLLSAGMDGRIREWDPRTGREIRVIEAHPKSTNTLSFHPDDALLTTGCSDGTAAVHAWPSLETVATLPPRKGATSVFTPLGDRILTTGLDGRPRLWTWPGLELVADIKAFGKKAVGTAFTPDAEHVLISGLDGTLARVRLKDGEVDVLRPAGGPLLCALAFVPGEDRVIMLEHGGSVRLFDWPGLEPLHESPIDAAGVFTLRFHPSEEVFALCVERGVQIRRSADGSLLGTLAIPAKGVYALAFSADEQWLAAGGADQRIRIWRMTPER